MTTTNVTFEATNGGDVNGLVFEPGGSGKAPAVVLVQEWWGVNQHIRTLAERLAAEGFLVVAPDLYHGTIATDEGDAAALMNALDPLQAVQEIGGAAAFARAHARGNGKVGVVGFCMGGALAFASACHVDGLSAVVPFYGTPPAEKVDYAKVTAPVLAHFANNDAWATVAKAEAIKEQLEAHGKTMRLETYDAGHAFMNDSRPEAYHEASAKLAWQRTVDFLKSNVG